MVPAYTTEQYVPTISSFLQTTVNLINLQNLQTIVNQSTVIDLLQILVFCALLGVSFAAPQQQPNTSPIPILKYESEGPNPDGSYRWA